MSALEDILWSVSRVLEQEQSLGIVDLDALGAQWDPKSTSLPTLTLEGAEDGQPYQWVKAAHTTLSSFGRPTGWLLDLGNRSIVHAFLEHAKVSRFHCAWRPVDVVEWKKVEKIEGETKIVLPQQQLQVTDSMIRVENCSEKITVDNLRHLFRRFDTASDGPAIIPWEADSKIYHMFVVHFADPSWARAAVRELQGIKFMGSELRLAQYPRQLQYD